MANKDLWSLEESGTPTLPKNCNPWFTLIYNIYLMLFPSSSVLSPCMCFFSFLFFFVLFCLFVCICCTVLENLKIKKKIKNWLYASLVQHIDWSFLDQNTTGWLSCVLLLGCIRRQSYLVLYSNKIFKITAWESQFSFKIYTKHVRRK